MQNKLPSLSFVRKFNAHHVTLAVCTIVFSGAIGYSTHRIAKTGKMFNWDMLGYVACALSLQNDNIEEVHTQTYAAAKEVTTPKQWKELISFGGRFRKEVHKHPHLFETQLPFYKMRLLYTSLVLLLSKLGMHIVDGIQAISYASYILTCLLIFIWLARLIHPVWALIGAYGISQTPIVIYATRLSTPDALITFLGLLTIFFLVAKPKPVVSAILLVLMVWTRTDSIIFAGVTIMALKFVVKGEHRASWLWFGSTLSAAVASYFFLNIWGENRGWWVIFVYTNGRIIPDATKISGEFDLDYYFKVVGRKLSRFWGSPLMLFPFFPAIGATIAKRVSGNSRNLASVMFLVFLFVCVTRFFLMPVFWDRLFAPYIIGMMLLTAEVAIKALRQPEPALT